MTRQTKVSLLLVTTALVFVLVALVDANLVTRPTKTCGNTSYVDEVADGCTTILAAEVDADLVAIINGGVNNITAANLATDAVSTVKIQNLAVTTGKIDNLAVTTGKIADSAVTTGKLADSATFTQVVQTTGGVITPIGTNTLLHTQAITMGRTKVSIRVYVYGDATTVTSAGAATYTLRVLRDASPIYTTPSWRVKGEAANTFVFPVVVSAEVLDGPGVGSHTYTVELTESDAGNTTTSVQCRIILQEIV